MPEVRITSDSIKKGGRFAAQDACVTIKALYDLDGFTPMDPPTTPCGQFVRLRAQAASVRKVYALRELDHLPKGWHVVAADVPSNWQIVTVTFPVSRPKAQTVYDTVIATGAEILFVMSRNGSCRIHLAGLIWGKSPKIQQALDRIDPDAIIVDVQDVTEKRKREKSGDSGLEKSGFANRMARVKEKIVSFAGVGGSEEPAGEAEDASSSAFPVPAAASEAEESEGATTAIKVAPVSKSEAAFTQEAFHFAAMKEIIQETRSTIEKALEKQSTLLEYHEKALAKIKR